MKWGKIFIHICWFISDCLIILLNVVININFIRTQSYYDPEDMKNDEDPNYYHNQRPKETTYDNEQEPENYEDGEPAAVEEENTNFPEEETEVKESKEVQVETKKPRSAMKKSQTPVQVNLDQLVEKVRERLLGDVKGKKSVRLKQKVKKPRIVAQGGGRKKKGAQAPNNKPNSRVNRGEVIEQHDLYEKTALHETNAEKKDSYEDYVTPKKDANALISVEEEIPTSPSNQVKVSKVLRQPVKKLKGPRQKQVRQATKGQKPGGPRPDQKTMVKKNLPKRKKKTTYVAPEYDDDTPPPTTPPLKVRTEIIGQIDYKDLSAESMAKLKARDATAKSKKVKIVTNMQTRAKFSFSSPNYYAKLPRIAEKYNFDEPIPQKDQEEEKLKEFANGPDVLINKKMQVNPQATLPIVP